MQGPYIVFPLRRGLPQYMLPSFFHSFGEDISMFSIPVGDLIQQAQLDSMKRDGKALSWLPKNKSTLAVWTDVIGQATHGVTGGVDNMYVSTDTGKSKITEDELKGFVGRSAGCISAIVLPVEQVAYNEESGASKRARRSVDGILHFLDVASSGRPQLQVYANLCGGGIPKSREIALDILKGKGDFDGLYISGFETFTAFKRMSAESERETRGKVLETISLKLCEAEVFSNVPKVICFTGWLYEICHTLLYPIIDHISIGSPTILAALGLQIMFDFRVPRKIADLLQMPDLCDANESADEHLRNVEEWSISDLRLKLHELLLREGHCLMRCRALAEKEFAASEEAFSKIYEFDFFVQDGKEIIVQNKSVKFVCRDYSQAYIHHLLNCREPLAFQVLEWDNWQSICLLFRIIRRLGDERSRLLYLLCFVVKNFLSGNVKPYELDPLAYKMPETYTVTE